MSVNIETNKRTTNLQDIFLKCSDHAVSIAILY